MRQRSIFSLSVLTVPLCHQAGNATTPAVTKMRLKNVDCKQSPFFSYDRRDQALTFTGGHLGRVSTLGGGGGGRVHVKTKMAAPVAENVRS